MLEGLIRALKINGAEWSIILMGWKLLLMSTETNELRHNKWVKITDSGN